MKAPSNLPRLVVLVSGHGSNLQAILDACASGYLPAQVAAVRALEAAGYYAQRYEETHKLRDELMAGLRGLGWDVVPSMTNFLLCHLPENGPDGATIISRSREQRLFLRETSSMSAHLGPRTIRVAVKDKETNSRMLAILQAVCREQ